MEPHKIRDISYDVTTFNLLRFYHLFDPDSPKIYNYNVYQLTIIVLNVFVLCTSLYGTLGFITEMEDTVDNIGLFNIVIALMQMSLAVLKTTIPIYNADKIWNLFHITRPHNFTNKIRPEHIEIQRDYLHKTLKFTNLLLIFIMNIIVAWLIFPIILNSFKANPNVRTQRYENLFNLRYPVTINVFNDYYFVFYVFEVSLLILIVYGAFIFDAFLILYLCNIFIATYTTISQDFEIIGHEEQFLNGKLMILLLYKRFFNNCRGIDIITYK